MVRGELVAVPELRVEAAHGVLVEAWRLGHELVTRGEARQLGAMARRAEPAEHELRKEAVAAFLEITAVGHLRNDVGRTHHLAQAAGQSVTDADRLGLALVTGETEKRRG